MRKFRKLFALVIVASVMMSLPANAKTPDIGDEELDKIIEQVVLDTQELNNLLDGVELDTKTAKNASDKTKSIANALLGKDVYETSAVLYATKGELTASTKSLYSRGEKGNYLVTTDPWVGSIPLPGHAGIIYNSSLTIESFAAGVNWNLVSHWEDDYDKVFEYHVNADSFAANSAVNYAIAQIGDPYNYIFNLIWIESRFYCSQLVWRSWYEQGFDLDGLYPVNIVAPIDLTYADDTTIVYSSLW